VLYFTICKFAYRALHLHLPAHARVRGTPPDDLTAPGLLVPDLASQVIGETVRARVRVRACSRFWWGDHAVAEDSTSDDLGDKPIQFSSFVDGVGKPRNVTHIYMFVPTFLMSGPSLHPSTLHIAASSCPCHAGAWQ
jgi:hypothetical protein